LREEGNVPQALIPCFTQGFLCHGKLAAFTDETGQPLRFTQSGAWKIVLTERHARQLSQEGGRAAGVPIELISVAEARQRPPTPHERGIVAVA
jgi:hypothetical protein